jgi:uncharacterized repeat protein (TIGR01451 family)
MSKLILAARCFSPVMLITVLWAVPPPTFLRKPSVASLTGPTPPRLQRVSAISPLRFEPNMGQAGPGVRYIARGPGYMLLLAGKEAVMVLPSDSSASALVRMKLLGAANTSASHPENPLPSVSNYYIGDDPTKWHPNVPNYERVKFEQVYPGIDLVYYGNQQRLEYDFVLRPGAEPNQIRLAYSGADSMHLDSDGDLILNVHGQQLRQRRPVVYQEIGGKRVEVAGGYELIKRTGQVRIVVAHYDRAKPLIVDPTLVYSTYLGGSGVDQGNAIAVDSTGAAYVTGTTSGSFPTLNAEQNTYGGGNDDAYVAKFSPTGALVYSTYLGGPNFDKGTGIGVDTTGAAYVTGYTTGGFPTLNAEQSTFGGNEDAFVVKLSPTGALVYSTYIGGLGSDEGLGIAVDSTGAACVAGFTSGNFPTLNAAQNTFGGSSDAFVAKLSPTGALVYSTYLGGSNQDNGYGIAVDSTGAAYVTGFTNGGFPTLNAEQNTFGGTSDAFAAKLSPTGVLVYSTYLGGPNGDFGYGIAVDSTGAAYVTGTTSAGFPTFNAGQNTFGGAMDAFVTKLSPTGALVYSTFLGGTGTDIGYGIAVDSTGTAYVTGQTDGAFPTLNAVQNTPGGSADAFIASLSPSGALSYSTYLGGTSTDQGSGIATDGNGAAYVVGITNGNFPTLNAAQGTFGGPTDAFIAKLSGNPSIPPDLLSLNPSSAPAGTNSLILRVNGTGFSSGSMVLWNGGPVDTAFVSPTQLNGTIPSSLLNAAGAAIITVGNSASLTFTILPPAVNLLSPQAAQPGSPPFTLTIGGTNFVPGSTVRWNGGNLSTTFINSTTLNATVPTSLLTTVGTANVTVVSASSTSNGFTFIIGTPVLNCVVSAPAPPVLRLEAYTELLGDLVLNCNGGTLGQTLTSDLTVSTNVNVTSRILNAGTQATEALLLIDDPSPGQQVLNSTVFQGTLTGPNTITFRGVPIKQPGAGTRVLRIVNLRGNAHQFQQASNLNPVPVTAILSLSGPVAITNAQQTNGFVAPTTQFRLGSNVGSLADQRTVAVSFTEDFASAFKIRVAAGGQQNIPGTVYKTESGFVNTALLPTAGLADSATRLLVQFSGVPAGVNVYAPIFPDGNTNAQLVTTDSNGAGPASFIPGANMFGGKYSQVTIANGSGVAVWEVTATDPALIETLQFHVLFTGMTQAGIGPIGFAGSLAPLSNVSTASATDPLPRIAADSITRFVNMSLTSTSTAASGVGALALPGVRPSELQRTIRAQSAPQVQVGSNLSFVYTVLNNGPGPAPGVTVQSNLPSTLSFLDCATSTGGTCSAATNPDGSTTVTGGNASSLQPGQSQYFVIHGQPLNGALGATASVSTLVSSGKEDLDPSDNALITSFGVTNTAVTVPVSFSTNPAGLKVQVGASAPQVNPTVMVDQAVPLNFTVPSPQADPSGAPGKQYVFNSWNDGTLSAAHASVTPPIGGGTFTANFDAQYQITVTASPAAGGTVSVAPAAANNFYTAFAPVLLTATPASGYTFTGFTGDVTSAANPLSVVMPAAPLNIRANFVASVFAASPSAVQFGVTPGSTLVTSQQTINVQAPPGVTWSASANQSFISVSPTSGTGNGSFTISIVTSALPVSGTASGMVILTAPNFTTSPTVNVTAAIGAITKPFGSFDTPADRTTNIAGAIPVTGWALDSIEVLNVDIWREPVPGEATGSNGLVFIGDAVFVYGARPDVQAANPTLPLNTRGGWGYQMLTNFLPNSAGSGPSGNGVYRLHAIAHNKAGVAWDLGTKTITVDNAHASKPFGTIDTPGQGGTASGSAYLNFGWALTQNPNIIPLDGSTITVVVDGQFVGHPTYNNFRSDIASLFPGYMNSQGAVGFYYLDTTKLAAGVHTISWNVFDNAGHGEGLGSRYFNVFNSASTSTELGEPVEQPLPNGHGSDEQPSHELSSNVPQSDNSNSGRAATVGNRLPPWPALSADKLGLYKYSSPRERFPTFLEIEEVGRIEILLGAIAGYQLVNGQRTPLPIGSSLNRGVFYWQPGPGFLGDYTLVFERPDGTQAQVRVKIRPKTYVHEQ